MSVVYDDMFKSSCVSCNVLKSISQNFNQWCFEIDSERGTGVGNQGATNKCFFCVSALQYLIQCQLITATEPLEIIDIAAAKELQQSASSASFLPSASSSLLPSASDLVLPLMFLTASVQTLFSKFCCRTRI